MRALAIALSVLSASLAVFICVALVLAIWTVGPDADRWGATAYAAVMVLIVTGVGTGMAWSAYDFDKRYGRAA